MKLESILQRFLGKNKAVTVTRAQQTVNFVMKHKIDVLKLHGGTKFCQALNKITTTLDILNEKKLFSSEDSGYESFQDYLRAALSKVYDYLTVNPEITYIETAMLGIKTPQIQQYKQELDNDSLRMRKAANELSEAFENQYLSILRIKSHIRSVQETRKNKEENYG